MSDINESEGWICFRNEPDTRAWFREQWKRWPERVDERYTTNISFLYGALMAFRHLHKSDPPISRAFREQVEWLDNYPVNPH